MTKQELAQQWIDIAEKFSDEMDNKFTCVLLDVAQRNKKISYREHTQMLVDFWGTKNVEYAPFIPLPWHIDDDMARSVMISNTTRMLYALSLAYLNDPESLDFGSSV